jgi:hypothetical protein
MRRCWVLPVLTWLVCATPAFAQTNLQLWGNVTLDWIKSDRLTWELDLEPKVLLAAPEGEPGWRNLDLTSNGEYSWKRWLDLVGEATVGRTYQTDDVTTFEVTPRVGVRFHVFSRDTKPYLPKVREVMPKRRVVVRDLLRVESRNFFYTGSGAAESFSSSVRFRNRIELQVPINKPSMTSDGAHYVLADWEYFMPLSEPEERFASKQRIRAGFGYRRNLAWRFEVLYMWTRSRDTVQEGFKTDDNLIDIRIKRVF